MKLSSQDIIYRRSCHVEHHSLIVLTQAWAKVKFKFSTEIFNWSCQNSEFLNDEDSVIIGGDFNCPLNCFLTKRVAF